MESRNKECIYRANVHKASNLQYQFNQIWDNNLFATLSKKILQKVNFNDAHFTKTHNGYAWLEDSGSALVQHT